MIVAKLMVERQNALLGVKFAVNAMKFDKRRFSGEQRSRGGGAAKEIPNE